MEFGVGDTADYSNAKNVWISVIVWFILLMNFVSISLLVTLEMVKFSQAYFIQEDYLLYDINKDMPAKV
jgi:magnesium-transporting ATPase (P-type)